MLRTAQHDAWPEPAAFLVAAERSGMTACAASVGWEFMVTSQFLRTAREIASGAAYTLRTPGPVPPGAGAAMPPRKTIVTTGAK